MSKLIMGLWVVAMLALAACGTASPTTAPTQPVVSDATEEATSSDNAPGDAEATAEGAGNDIVDTVRTFIQAGLEGDTDTVASLYCDAVPTDSMPASVTPMPGLTYDLSELTFTVVEESADAAQVQVEGTLINNMDIGGQVTSTDIEYASTSFDLVNEDGWKICTGGS